MYQLTKNLDDICNKARELCEQGPSHNLILLSEFPIGLIHRPFNDVHMEIARAWQNPIKSDALHINHGGFIHRSGDGVQHIVEELVSRPDSNRALCSLISMSDIMRSGDSPIPSFLVAQFGVLNKVLYCTTYFRALEVLNFLPINITELCILMQQIQKKMQNITTVRMCIHAFRAYAKPDFDCLQKSTLDQQQPGLISTALFQLNRDTVRSWLVSKLKESTVIETSGLAEMVITLEAGAEKLRDTFSLQFTRAVTDALRELERLKELRSTSSHSREVDGSTETFRDHLKEAIRLL